MKSGLFFATLLMCAPAWGGMMLKSFTISTSASCGASALTVFDSHDDPNDVNCTALNSQSPFYNSESHASAGGSAYGLFASGSAFGSSAFGTATVSVDLTLVDDQGQPPRILYIDFQPSADCTGPMDCTAMIDGISIGYQDLISRPPGDVFHHPVSLNGDSPVHLTYSVFVYASALFDGSEGSVGLDVTTKLTPEPGTWLLALPLAMLCCAHGRIPLKRRAL